MALAAADFTNIKHTPLGVGRWMVTGLWTLPASYTSGGEVLTTAILKAKTRLKSVSSILFTPQAGGIAAGFDASPVTPGTDQGKLHAYQSGLTAHSHDLLVKGGQSTSNDEPLFLTDPASTQNLGKNAATDRTVAGGSATTGGVQAVAAVNAQTEVASGQNLSTKTVAFVMYGS